MTTKEEQLNELARLAAYPCEMHTGSEFYPCAEGNDCTKCGIATQAAEDIYSAGYRKQEEARWKGAGMGDYYCSLCQHQISERTKFCPNCGAKMDEWEEDGME